MFEESVSNAIPSIWASMNSWFTPALLFVLLNVMIATIAFTSTLANQKQHHSHQHQLQSSQNDPQQTKLARSPSVLQRLSSINFYNFRSHDPNSVATHFKTTSDSDTIYNFEQTHQPQILGKSQSQLVFEETHQERQAIFGEQVQGNQTHYFFQHTHEENVQENRTHFDFEQAHEENAQENRTNFEYEPAHEENVEDEGLQSLDEVYSQLKERHVGRSKSDTKPVAGEIPARLPTKMKKSASLKSAFKHFEGDDIVEPSRPATVRERSARVTEVDDEVDAKADDFINRFKQQLKLQRLDSILRYKEMIGRGSGK